LTGSSTVPSVCVAVIVLASSAAAMERPGRINAARNAVIVVLILFVIVCCFGNLRKFYS